MASQESNVAVLKMNNLTHIDETPTKPSPQFPLLTLAPEIRDLIYRMVLTTTRPEPRNPTDRSQRQQLNNDNYNTLEHTTWYPIKPLPSPASSLLLTCHQVRDEIIDLFVLEQKCNKYSRYELSITIMEEQFLYPTWLLVPLVPSELASLVWVDIHIAGFCTSRHFRSGWHPSDGWVPELIWGLFTILNRFLLYGPSFSIIGIAPPVNIEMAFAEHAPHLKPQCHPIRELKLLVLNVITPTKAEMGGKSFRPKANPFSYKDRVEGLTHPETVMQTLENHMLHVIEREGHAAGYSQLVYERMKLVQLCLDGKERCLWEVQDRTQRSPGD